jgi:hypothetical protein
MVNTMIYGYVPCQRDGEPQRHIVGYQNEAESLLGDNFMLLNFAGTDLRLVRGPEHTTTMMSDITRSLQQLVVAQGGSRSGGLRDGSYSVQIEEYGDYTIFLSQSPSAIVEAVMDHPASSSYDAASIRDLAVSAEYFEQHYPFDSFLVPMFKRGVKVKPTHPIVVSYVPRQPECITVPGLDGHDGTMPIIGSQVVRNFKLAFGVHGVDLHPVRYKDANVSPLWAPESIVGFVDNRFRGANGNYSLPIEVIRNYVDDRDEFERRYFAPGTSLVKRLVLGNL